MCHTHLDRHFSSAAHLRLYMDTLWTYVDTWIMYGSSTRSGSPDRNKCVCLCLFSHKKEPLKKSHKHLTVLEVSGSVSVMSECVSMSVVWVIVVVVRIVPDGFVGVVRIIPDHHVWRAWRARVVLARERRVRFGYAELRLCSSRCHKLRSGTQQLKSASVLRPSRAHSRTYLLRATRSFRFSV